MTEYSKLAKGVFTATTPSQFVNLPFRPDFVELWNYTNIKTAAANKMTRAWWTSNLIDGTANPTMIEIYNNSSAVVFDTIQTAGISNFYANTVQGGASKQIVAITKATNAQVTVTAHGYNVGDVVALTGLYQSSTTGMPQISSLFFNVVTRVDANNFTINWNTNQSNYTALSASPTGATCTQIFFSDVYAPQVNTPATITTGATTTISTTFNHNFVVGQQIAFHIPPAWGITELNSSASLGSPLYGYVTSITDNLTFVCNINSLGFTAYNTNQPVASVPGMSTPTVCPVGDINTGGWPITATSALYPSPLFPTFTGGARTINGPAIQGAFVNNTRQGFFIGAGLAAVDTTVQIMAASDVIVWKAYLHDYNM
jgi:hypothetical protein